MQQNERLQSVYKINYLRSQLVGLAIETFAGLDLTNGNCNNETTITAIKLIKERYD